MPFLCHLTQRFQVRMLILCTDVSRGHQIIRGALTKWGWPPFVTTLCNQEGGRSYVYKTWLVGKGIKNGPSIYKSYQLWFICNRCHLSCWRRRNLQKRGLFQNTGDKIPRLILQPRVSSEQNSRYSQWNLNCSHPDSQRSPWANKSWKKASKLTGTIYQLEVFNSMPSHRDIRDTFWRKHSSTKMLTR